MTEVTARACAGAQQRDEATPRGAGRPRARPRTVRATRRRRLRPNTTPRGHALFV